MSHPVVHHETGASGPDCGTKNATQTTDFWSHVTCRRCLARHYLAKAESRAPQEGYGVDYMDMV